MSFRLLDSSTEHAESDSWRIGGLSVESTSPVKELSLGKQDSQVRVEGSRSQRGQQQDQSAEVYGALSCGRGRSLDGTAGEGMLTGHLKDSGRSFNRDEIDSSALSIHGIVGQRVSKDSATDGRPGSDKSAGGDNSILAGDRGGALTATINYSEGAGINSGEGSVELGEGLSPGGGAFLPFRRDPTRKLSTTPTQHTMVKKCGYFLPSG